jgi:S-(hydroxymethyl)glutathione dehydrogenase/alcohol dehydrogenase
MNVISSVTICGGTLRRVEHDSSSTKTKMTFAVFTPPTQIPPQSGFPALFWLSGLTCNDTNFCQKATPAFVTAASEGISLVIPDTSPRGAGIDGEDASYDFGTGAGFYLNATKAPWSTNYNMYSYVTEELPSLLSNKNETSWRINSNLLSISGHSMGGHGALTIAFKSPKQYASVSAFAPIVDPLNCPWGMKALDGYLNNVKDEGDAYSAVSLLKASGNGFNDSLGEILIDQGANDEFLESQLCPGSLQEAAKSVGQKLRFRTNEGYDHSYYFVASFISEHVSFAANALRKRYKSQQEASEAMAATQQASEPASAAAAQAIEPLECQAMIAFAPNEPLRLETIIVAPPKAGEVRVKVIANALCHTDVYTWSGQDPEGLFPSILGHEAGAIVESIGEGVTSLKVGDHIVPGYTPQCASPQCIFCMSPKTNLCPTIRSTQGKGVMPDGTSRFTLKSDGSTIYHFMGCSTFSEYTVLAEISCAKINNAMPLEKACLFGCGVATGLGAVINTTKVQAGATVAVFGLGAVGLSVIQAAHMVGASRIIAIDINPDKYQAAQQFGATDFVNSRELPEGTTVQSHIVNMTKWGVDYSYDCTGSVEVMRAALECAHRGWGMSCVIGVAASGQEIKTRPFQLVTGRKWVGTAFGGWKTRTDIPRLVDQHLDGKLPIDGYITHTLDGVGATNEAIKVLKSGNCLRCVVVY